jgi:hypothetical protein
MQGESYRLCICHARNVDAGRVLADEAEVENLDADALHGLKHIYSRYVGCEVHVCSLEVYFQETGRMIDESMQVADILGVGRPQTRCHSEALQVREQGSHFRCTIQRANETRNVDAARAVPYLAMRRDIGVVFLASWLDTIKPYGQGFKRATDLLEQAQSTVSEKIVARVYR